MCEQNLDIPTARFVSRHGVLVGLVVFPIALASAAFAQNASSRSIDAVALVRRAVQHRLESAKTHSAHQYVVRRTDERRDSTKVVIETADGNVARLIAINGKPLSPDVDKAELDRLDHLAMHPELQAHRRKSEQKDMERTLNLLSMLPDAFEYLLEGMVPCDSGRCYRLSFSPNPHFTPPDLEANIFRGIAGELWIDQEQERLTRLDAHFIADVDFGFGLLGRLNKGGTVRLEQTNVGGNDWELTGLTIHVTGKALMVRSFNFQVTEKASRYETVAPGIRYRDAIDLLKTMDLSGMPDSH